MKKIIIILAGNGYHFDYTSGFSSHSDPDNLTGMFGTLFLITLFCLFVFWILKTILTSAKTRSGGYIMQNAEKNSKDEQFIINEIKAHDINFNPYKVIEWSKNMLIRYLQSIQKRNASELKPYTTFVAFKSIQDEMQAYIDDHVTNIIDRIRINSSKLFNYKIQNGKELLTIYVEATLRNYLIEDGTKKILVGNPNMESVYAYFLTFERNLGEQTPININKINSISCPFCGAPAQITSFGKCDYCGSVITAEYYWSLNKIQNIPYTPLNSTGTFNY